MSFDETRDAGSSSVEKDAPFSSPFWTSFALAVDDCRGEKESRNR